MMNRPLQKNNIVLVGIGHTNAHILKRWRMKPINGADLVCVSNFPKVTYSGMLPGVLSGQYRPDEMEIDLVRLCSVSGARLIVGDVTGVDRQSRTVLFHDRPPLPFDFMSIGVGSRPTFGSVNIAVGARVLAIKPMQTFLSRLRAALDEATSRHSGPLNINIVGGGVGGIEIAFCLTRRLRREFDGLEFNIRLFAGREIGTGLNAHTRRNVIRELKRAAVQLVQGSRVESMGVESLQLDNGDEYPNDIAIWATGAVASPLHDAIDLKKDDRGFFLIEPTLQSVEDQRIFAVGDSGSLIPEPTPKAGVYAVRQGPVLWENLKRSVAGRPLKKYKPQEGFLKLLNLGDDRAIAEYVGRSFVGSWCWKLKDYIDRKFMKMYQDYKPMKMKPGGDHEAEEVAMRCLGCGGKIGGGSLGAALSRLSVHHHDDVIVGLRESDDAAIVRVPQAQTTVTTDFFAAPVDDPYLVGRIAALNSASDCFAMNARPSVALTIAQVPHGHPRAQAETLFEMMAGAQTEFEKMGTAIVGGHSIEGPRMLCGFTILANQLGEPTPKSGLKPGDHLVITKPIGTGVLLAAMMKGQCHAEWYQALVGNMLLSNEIALDLVQEFEISSMTDITGFGLVGHLMEMLEASDAAAVLEMEQVPLLPGAAELTNHGVESTMTPQNRERAVQVNSTSSDSDALLYDPQTCGGLLIGIAEDRLAGLIDKLHSAGFERAADIGVVYDRASLDLSLTIR